ncbi:MAG: hypothetical protein MR981_03005, partial [Ruminococcus bromii]|nr:hypothetical protein [Ruminococcus bromii]
PTSLVAASSGSENLEISIYNTLPFVKVNPWYFSFFPQKSELHFGNLPIFPLSHTTRIYRQKSYDKRSDDKEK